MLTDDQLDRVHVVLVRARNPNNIGAVARAMHDFGFRRLAVVNEFAVPFEAARSAVDASEVLADAVIHGSVREAVADCTLVVGTTAVGERKLEHELLSSWRAGAVVREELMRGGGAGRVALLFGSEKTGLSNEELSYCHWLLTIPMYEHAGGRHASMNLGQAVAVCLYELVRGGEGPDAGGAKQSGGTQGASAAEQERLVALLREVLGESGYARHHPANSDEAQIRRMVLRMGFETKDAVAWMGVLRQILWKLRDSERVGEL